MNFMNDTMAFNILPYKSLKRSFAAYLIQTMTFEKPTQYHAEQKLVHNLTYSHYRSFCNSGELL